MKFLSLGKPIHGPPLSPEQMKANLKALEATVNIFKELKEKEKVDCYYSFAGLPAGFAIFDVDSHEELNELIMSLPVSAAREIYPLTSVESSLEALKKAAQGS